MERSFIEKSGTGRMVDSCLKNHLPFLLKPPVLIGIRRGGLLFLSNYLISFWEVWALSIFLAFGGLGSCPFIFLTFGALSVRNTHSPSCHLGQWGRLSGTLTIYGNRNILHLSEFIEILVNSCLQSTHNFIGNTKLKLYNNIITIQWLPFYFSWTSNNLCRHLAY